VHAWDCDVMLEALASARSEKLCKTRAALAQESSMNVEDFGRNGGGTATVSHHRVEVVTWMRNDSSEGCVNGICDTAATDALIVRQPFCGEYHHSVDCCWFGDYIDATE
jgi:hypothetical protein